MGQLRDSSGASCWLLTKWLLDYWKSVSVASGQHRPQILFLIWCLNWLIYVDYMIMATDTIHNLMPKLVDLWFRRLQKTVAPKGPETAQFPLYKIFQPRVLGFNNCPQFWLKLKPLVVQMVSCDRAHVSTCPLIFQYYSTGTSTSCTASSDNPVLVFLLLVRWHFESPTFRWEERDDKGSCTYYVITDSGGGLSKWLQYYIGVVRQMITVLHGGGVSNDYGTPWILGCYIRNIISRDLTTKIRFLSVGKK